MERNEAYAKISDLLTKGFLSVSLNICGNAFILKTVTQKEIDLIKLLLGSTKGESYLEKYNIYSLVYSILAINGENFLCKKDRGISELYPLFASVSERLFARMLSELDELRKEMYLTLKYLEGYTYTNKSRHRWKSCAGMRINLDEITGVPGTSLIGTNIHQDNWIAINKMLDEEERYNKDFSLALFVASATNPKGVRQIRGQHEMDIQRMEERRTRIAKEGFIDTKKDTSGWAAPVDTAEELVAELERQVHGKKDRHDIFMEKYMERLKKEAEQRRLEAEARIRRAREAAEGLPLITSEQRVLTNDEMTEYMTKRRTVEKVLPDHMVTANDKDKFLKKMGNRVLTGRR